MVLARELIEIKQRPVTTSEIAAYGDEQVHQLAPLLAAIDAARSMERRVSMGKRIATEFSVSYAAISAYKTNRVRAAATGS